jgi:hypothetical protein
MEAAEMAKNDSIIIDAIVDDRLKAHHPSDDRGEVFEIFAFEQVLKDLDLSNEELQAGWVDGKDDGGIDGIFLSVNGQFVTDPSTFPFPKRNAEVVLQLITCKHHDTFQQAPLDSLAATVTEFFDLSIENDDLKGAYSLELLNARAAFEEVYRRTAASAGSFHIRFLYVSRGDTGKIATNISSRSSQLVNIAKDSFSGCTANFEFIGSSELVTLKRKVRRTVLDLPFSEGISLGQGYVVLCKLRDFNDFISDEGGSLKRYLFEANVRDFLGANRVNEDIIGSLRSSSDQNFWWLNNGITVLTTTAVAIGKTLQLKDVQIVNGLQTSHTIHSFFSNGGDDPLGRSVLVKVIVSTDNYVRDSIIRATNNQSLVELSALKSTDSIQHDIEDVLERAGWSYERRKNYYRNIGRPEASIISPNYLASGVVALLLKSPDKASRLKPRFMRNDESYAKVFSPNWSMGVWPKIVEIMKSTEGAMRGIDIPPMSEARFIPTWRSLLMFMAVARITGRFNFSDTELTKFDASRIETSLLQELWAIIIEERAIGESSKGINRPFTLATQFRNPSFVKRCCERVAEKYSCSNVEIVCAETFSTTPSVKFADAEGVPFFKQITEPLSLVFLENVNRLLPDQPWKIGIHRKIAEKLECKPKEVSEAIDQLITMRKRYRQAYGKVYDESGKIIAELDD